MKPKLMRRAKVRQFLVTSVAPLVLIAVVIRHAYLVSHYDLTRWKGGGFGMFATIDRLEHRILRVKLYFGGETIPAHIRTSADYERLIWQVQSLPRGRHVEEFARRLSNDLWVINDGVAARLNDLSAWQRKNLESDAARADAIELSIYRIRFDPRQRERSMEQIVSYEFR